MAQKWHNLLFAHWPVSPAAIRKLIPEKLELDTYDGQAWISIVPFTMSDVRVRGMLALPWLSSFPELNVRTYVTGRERPGVWFFSLDAANPAAVEIARLWFHLPYFHSRMRSRIQPEGIVYSAERTDRRGAAEQLQVTYGADRSSFECAPGTLEYFLTERYCLYAQRPDGVLFCGEIHHSPWLLQEARASFSVNSMTKNLGIEISAHPLLLHFSSLQDVIVWPPKKISD